MITLHLGSAIGVSRNRAYNRYHLRASGSALRDAERATS